MPDGTTQHLNGDVSSPLEPTIEDYFSEDRVFPPSDEFRSQAVMSEAGVYERAEADRRGFWAEQAGALDWFRPWSSVLEWDPSFARWLDGRTLVSEGRVLGDTTTLAESAVVDEIRRWAATAPTDE